MSNMSSIGYRYELINSRLQLLKKGNMSHGEVLAEVASMMQEYGDTQEQEGEDRVLKLLEANLAICEWSDNISARKLWNNMREIDRPGEPEEEI